MAGCIYRAGPEARADLAVSFLSGTLARLRGRTHAELQDRVRQAAYAWAERSGLGGTLRVSNVRLDRLIAPGISNAPEDLLRNARTRPAPSPLPGLVDTAATAVILRDNCPAAADAIIARAERITAGRFDLLGYRDLSFGTPIDWHQDPVADRRAPLVHWSRVPYLDTAVVGDHKVVWELNRHQWLATLGQVYALTGDGRWAREIVQRLGEWLDANPPKLGINWASSLEVAFRAISWLCALRFIRASPALTAPLYARLLQSLHVHGRHLERYLSTYFSPNTHLTGEALGLFQLGTLLPELRAAPRWRQRGLDILQQQLPVHVYADGVYFEQATQYHRYTTDFYLHLVLLAQSNDVTLAPHVRPTLERLLEHLLHLSRPDGTIPLFGDDDGGRLVQLDDRAPDDVRSLLAAGAAVFNRADFAVGARGDVAGMIWLLGGDGLRRFQALEPKPPHELARGFADGGYYVTRDSWSPDASWLAFDCGPHGVMSGGHAHADALSFELAVAGRPVIVDSGTYSYSGRERMEFRDAAAHNTITVDGVSSSIPAEAPFRWRTRATARNDRWHADTRAVLMAGSHDGYSNLEASARHSRTILHLVGDYFVIHDRIESTGAHRIAARFHCAPGLGVTLDEATPDAASPHIAHVRDADVSLLDVRVFGGTGRLVVEEGWVSRQYGQRERGRVLTWLQEGTGSQQVVTFLLPDPSIADTQVRELPGAEGGLGFTLRSGALDDLLLIGNGGPVTAAGVQTDAAWLWVRRTSAGTPVEYVAIEASYARVDGGDLWPPERLAWRASAESQPR